MAKLLKLRRGTTTQHGSFTGAEGEVTIDTTKDTAVVHDGSTAGGRPLAREDLNNVSSSTIAGRLSNDSIAPAKIGAGTLPSDVTVASANLVDGTIVAADLATTGVTAGAYGSSSAIPIVTVNNKGQVTAASTTAIDSTTIANGTSNVAVANNGNITTTRSGTARHVVDDAGVHVTGTLDVTGQTNIAGGVLRLGTADSSSGHLNSYESMTFNIDSDSDDTNRFFKFCKNGSDGSGSQLFKIEENGDSTLNGTLYVTSGAQSTGNLDVSSGIDCTGELTVTSGAPKISLIDSGENPDFEIKGDGGTLKFIDATNNADRIIIRAGGTVDIEGNLDANSGLDVTGDISVTGTVDGVDVAALNTTVGNLGISGGAIASSTTATTQSASDNSTKVATTAYVTTGIANAQAFPSGTKMLFQQTSAPTGWTKVTSGVDNKALRVVSGTAGSGGSNAFSNTLASRSITANSANATATGSIALGNATAGGNITVANTTAGGNLSIDSASTGGTVNSHTLSTNEMPSHRHVINRQYNTGNQYQVANEGGITFHGQTIQWSNYVHYQQNNAFMYTNYVGGGGGHSHGFTGGSHNHSGTMSGTAHTHNASFTGTAHSHSASFSGSAHNHSISVTNLDLEVQYLDVIIASKD